jgi:hypothetical protein
MWGSLPWILGSETLIALGLDREKTKKEDNIRPLVLVYLARSPLQILLTPEEISLLQLLSTVN